MNNQLLTIPCELLSTMTKSISKTSRFVFESQENILPALIASVTEKVGKTGYLCFLVGEKPIDPMDVIDLPEIKVEKGRKSQAERIRATLWLVWKKNGEIGDAETFYNAKTEQYLDYLKKQLE